MSSTKTYFAAVDGFINNVYRKAGDLVGKLTDDEAKYLVMAGQITAGQKSGKKVSE